MDLENEPIADALKLIQSILLNLFEKKELIPNNWNKSYAYLIGVAIWDIFSNNHKVISKNNKVYNLGSWRVSGDNIAEVIEENFKEEPFYEYMDFYKGSIYQLPKDIELKHIYQEIFKILKQKQCDWHYASPTLHITELKNGKQFEKKKEVETLTDSLKSAYKKVIEKHEKNPVQVAIEAYFNVYQKLPDPVVEE